MKPCQSAIIVTLVTVVLTAYPVAESAAAADALPVFVLAGQSNMVGNRCRADELPRHLQLPNAKAVFYSAGDTQALSLTLWMLSSLKHQDTRHFFSSASSMRWRLGLESKAWL